MNLSQNVAKKIKSAFDGKVGVYSTKQIHAIFKENKITNSYGTESNLICQCPIFSKYLDGKRLPKGAHYVDGSIDFVPKHRALTSGEIKHIKSKEKHYSVFSKCPPKMTRQDIINKLIESGIVSTKASAGTWLHDHSQYFQPISLPGTTPAIYKNLLSTQTQKEITMPEPNTITMSRDAKDIIEMIKTLDLSALQDLQSMLAENPIQDLIRCKQYKMPNVKTGDQVFSIAIPGMTDVLDADNDYITIMWLGRKQLFTRDGFIFANGQAQKESPRMIWHNSEEFMIAAAENSYKKGQK